MRCEPCCATVVWKWSSSPLGLLVRQPDHRVLEAAKSLVGPLSPRIARDPAGGAARRGGGGARVVCRGRRARASTRQGHSTIRGRERCASAPARRSAICVVGRRAALPRRVRRDPLACDDDEDVSAGQDRQCLNSERTFIRKVVRCEKVARFRGDFDRVPKFWSHGPL
jgi:hypothetical protein